MRNFVVLASLIMALSPALSRGRDSDLIQAFLADYAPAAHELDRHYAALEIQATETRSNWPAYPTDRVTKLSLSRSGEYWRFDRHLIEGGLPEDIVGSRSTRVASPELNFRAVSEQGGAFMLNDVNNNHCNSLESLRFTAEPLLAAFQYRESSILEYLSSDDVSIVEVRQSQGPGNTWTMVIHEVDDSPMRGHFMLDPNAGWICRGHWQGNSYDADVPHPNGYLTTVTYDEPAGSIPLIRSFERFRFDGTGSGEKFLIEHVDIHLIKQREIPPITFTPAKLGVPFGSDGSYTPSESQIDIQVEEVPLLNQWQWTEHSVRLSNPGKDVILIVGANLGCFEQGCINIRDLPTELQPGETIEQTIQIKSVVAGEFSIPFSLYTNSAKRPTVTISIAGISLAEEESPEAE